MKITAKQIEEAIDSDGAWSILLAVGMVLSENAKMRGNPAERRTAARYARMTEAIARRMEREGI